MVSLLDPIVDATTPSYYGIGFSPIAWGGLATLDWNPVSFTSPSWWYSPGLSMGRFSYGSLFFPSTPMSHWGDEWLAADIFSAGSRLLNWGDALLAGNPWLTPFYSNAYLWQAYNPYPFGYYPFWTPQPYNSPASGAANSAPASAPARSNYAPSSYPSAYDSQVGDEGGMTGGQFPDASAGAPGSTQTHDTHRRVRAARSPVQAGTPSPQAGEKVVLEPVKMKPKNLQEIEKRYGLGQFAKIKRGNNSAEGPYYINKDGAVYSIYSQADGSIGLSGNPIYQLQK